MRRANLTPSEVERIGDLRRRNWTMEAIAAEIGCSLGSVRWACLREGFEPKKPRQKSRRQPTRPLTGRNGFLIRPFSPDEDARLLELERLGLSYTEIGRRLGRRHNSIVGRLYTLARHDALAEREQAR